MPSQTIEIQAAVCREFGKPLSVETLRLDPPRGNELRVKVLASSICHSDIIYMDGGWGGTLPAVFGHEVAGVVTDIGPSARSSDLHVGDRVMVSLLRSCGRCECCEAGAPTQCTTNYAIDSAPRLTDGRGQPVRAGLRVGGFAESVVVDASQVVKIPAYMPDEAACLVSCGVVTGFGAAINTAGVQVGDMVAVIGCGGVGLNCVQGAALAGALPLVAIDVSADKLAQARAFGATDTLDAAAGDITEKALALTDGRGFDIVMTAVGNARAIEAALPLLAREGALVVVGMPPDDERVSLNATGLAHYGQRILGSKMGAARLGIDVPKLFRLYRGGRLKLDELISSRRPLADINASIELSRRSQNLRHVIVFPAANGTGAE
ncbi:MAG: Zn-dependent alcohol dehydrogenase [Thiotrichales bacterium]|nr:Zn-dependent alcohol dehydrogenase [Thiotrichales bacterium]